MKNLLYFVAGDAGEWRVDAISTVVGDGVAAAARLARSDAPVPSGAVWTLAGTTSNVRYATRSDVTALRAVQQGLGRPQATRAALIPIRKSAAWWELAQDERMAIFHQQSRHNAIGLEYLPGIARQLIHCRDHGGEFDFLTWFEYAPEDADGFEVLVARLRATPEWRYVDREVDIRLSRAA